MNRISEILEASAKLRALHDRIHETVRTRDRGLEERERWSTACKEFHKRYDSLFYPGGAVALEAVRACDPGAIQTAIDFIVADPVHFRSGYTKDYLWARLLQCSLLPEDKARLESASLGYTRRRIDRSFWIMGRAMSRLASDDFWRRVELLTDSPDGDVRKRAEYLLVFKQGAEAGGLLRRKINREVILARYRSKRTNRDL